DMAVLDPELTVGLPPRITAFTGFDALTHAIEALASPRATPFTDSYALHAIRLITKYLPEAVANGSNLEARMRMLQASTMAIVAFGMSLSLVPIHNFAHAYGALFRIPHGLANAVFLPVVMESLPHLYLPRIVEYAQAFGLETGHRDPQKLLDDVIQTIRQMQQEVGLPSTFTEYNITADDLPKIVAAVVSDPTAVFFRLPPELITAVGQKVAGLTAASAEHSA
ncbi:MAG: iron-containing alcohol dehydrogenase, partial [Bacillota bacterium]